MTLNLGVGNGVESCRLPTWLIVLVDNHGAHAFIEIMTMDHA